MDRTIIYPGAIPLAEDQLRPQQFAQRAFSSLLNAVFGASSVVVDGFACTPTLPASLSVIVGPGSIALAAPADAGVYSTLPADTTSLLKQGDLLGNTTFPLTAPTSPGQGISYLVQVAFQEYDDTPTVLPYFNAAAPSVAWYGANNSATAQVTMRRQRAVLSIKAGAPAAAGTQSVPATDVGASPLWIVAVGYGQTAINAGSIAQHPQAPYLAFKLPQLTPGFSRAVPFTASTSWTVPNGVTRVRATVVGAGGGGGSSSSATPGANYSSGAGGGAGGFCVGIYTVTPGQVIPVTIGAGGGAQSAGGSSSFGTFLSATGGGGAGATGVSQAGGSGGQATGGTIINAFGGYGSDGQGGSFTGMGNGAPGPFGGGGRAATGSNGVAGQSYGAGGGGTYGGTGTGGSGAGGIVIVEF